MYRDSLEQCPRCHAALEDAQSARGCRTCGGLWVEEPVLREMVLRMLPPGELDELSLAVLERRHDGPLACPTCGSAMQQTELQSVPIDRCEKHGVWFDALELETALRRVGDPSVRPPAQAPVKPVVPRTEREGSPFAVTFKIQHAGEPVDELTVRKRLIKIGRLASATIRLPDDDETAGRMHAVIELEDPMMLRITDLGAPAGTLVNGRRVDRSQLWLGDVIKVGSTTIVIGKLSS